jgi:hypothetical protein
VSVRFIAIFKAPSPPWGTEFARSVEPGVIDVVSHVAYEESGQRWGFVTRRTFGSGTTLSGAVSRPYKPDKHEARGWVKLPSPILDEEWPADPRRP